MFGGDKRAQPKTTSDSWIAVPKRTEPAQLPEIIPESYRINYREAQLIFTDSPRMSAVLARRILADLLEQYANLKDFKLSTRIDRFIEDSSHPSSLRENLHYLREIADFGAHTIKDSEDRVIEASPVEAEWTLTVVDRLFEYFIIGPQRDKAMRTSMDEKLAKAQRKPIKPLGTRNDKIES